MQHSALILSPLEDINAATLYFCLQACGVRPLWSPSLDSAELGPLALGWERAKGWTTSARDLGGDLRSVWCRRPRDPEPSPRLADCDVDFVQDEWALFQENAFALGPELMGALWVNPALAARRAENKLLQLHAARQAGLAIPETLATNDPLAVRAFLRGRGRVIFKPFNTHTWRDREGRLRNAVAALLDDPAELDDASIAVCPGIYQAYVDKVADLRVTVIGNRCFAARITKAEGGAFVDWRPRTYMPDLAAEAVDLPAGIEGRILDLMARLGIVFGCVDLVATATGDLVFLEVNQGGQFMFMEELVPRLPLLKAMCALLAEGRPDYSMAGLPDISLDFCSRLESYQAWRDVHVRELGVESWLVSQES